MIVLIIKIIIVVTLINSDPCPTVSRWVLEFLANYAWKVLENSFSIRVTNCVGALHAVVRTRCTPWGLPLKTITWHIRFPMKPHVTEHLITFQGKNASVSQGLKIPDVTFVDREIFFFFFPNCLQLFSPKCHKKMPHFSDHLCMWYYEIWLQSFQNWKGGK